ncbi:MAG: FixH family protein [Bacteroidetes bacterium]|nr:FixH family protein [Bacteroidota bacterium]
MKMNWGYSLVLVFIAFGGMIGWLVYRCTQTNSDLVTADYYKDELQYQQTIDGARSASLLAERVNVRLGNDSISIRFPSEMKNVAISGNAWFYCAADARRDKKIALQGNVFQQISRRQFLPGHYIVKISWNSGDRFYYSEQPISIE